MSETFFLALQVALSGNHILITVAVALVAYFFFFGDPITKTGRAIRRERSSKKVEKRQARQRRREQREQQ